MIQWLTHIQPWLMIMYTLLFSAGVLVVLSVAELIRTAQVRSIMNRRLQMARPGKSVEHMIGVLRRERALDEDGGSILPSEWFNRLVTRSGLVYDPVKWIAMDVLVAVGIGGGIAVFTHKWAAAILVTAFLFFALPVMILKSAGTKRSIKLAQQLPDALQVAVRSLEAGHPIPTAITLVGREMEDPIGTEFGMIADEIAFGSSLSDGVIRMASRVDDEDIDLFAATIGLQEKTGGNLAELLKVNATTIRDRQMLRLKVKAASSEGRMSAPILTAAPFIVVGGVHFLSPEFYGDVIHVPWVKYALAGFLGWMFIGNMIMRKMIRFRI